MQKYHLTLYWFIAVTACRPPLCRSYALITCQAEQCTDRLHTIFWKKSNFEWCWNCQIGQKQFMHWQLTRKTPDSLKKLQLFMSCWIWGNFSNFVKRCLWQHLNYLSPLVNTAKTRIPTFALCLCFLHFSWNELCLFRNYADMSQSLKPPRLLILRGQLCLFHGASMSMNAVSKMLSDWKDGDGKTLNFTLGLWCQVQGKQRD